MEVLAPRTLAEAAEMLAAPDTRAIAGGTALQATWAQGAPRPARLVRLDALGLGGLSVADGMLRIGATVTLAGIETSPAVAQAAPLLARAVLDVGAPGVRRLGTLGGQLGWGAGCLLPALLALGARVRTEEQSVPLADWLAAPGRLALGIELPAQDPGPWAWRKVGLRAAFTPAVIAVAGAGGRLAAGGGVVRPQRLHTAEAALAAGAPDADLAVSIEAELEAPDCAFRSAAYRRRVAARALLAGLRGIAPAAAAAAPTPRPPAGTAPAGLRPLVRDTGRPDWHPRADMPAKIAGRAGYLTDARAPGMLVGRILRAGRPHARIVELDTSAAETMDGVRAVVTARDVPGENAFGIMWQDQPALCGEVVRYEGDPVAAVAAVDAGTAEAALAAIRVVWQDLPVIDDPEAALEEGAPALHSKGNLAGEVRLDRGDMEAGWAAAVHVVEDTYVTPRQMHAFLETEGGWCAPTDQGVEVHVGGQHGARDREQLARILALPETAIRVVTSPIGGGFGGKDELTVQPALALLALKARAPVRLHLSRAESVLAGVKRNPMRIRMRTGCDAEGRLVAQEVAALADSGAYASLSPAVLETAMEHACGPYRVPNVASHGRLAYTNNGAGGAFRGFGANQMTFAIECQMDRLAARAGLDPAEIRRRNLRVPGTPGYLGHRVAGSERLAEMLEAAASDPLWQRAGAAGTGVGMALNLQGNGLGSLPRDEAAAALRLAPDGAVEVLCGLDEMGQGLVPALQASVAAHLGCDRGDVRPVSGDTGAAPDSGSTSASRGAFVAWQAAARCAPGFAAEVLARAAARTGMPAEALRIVPGGVGEAARNAPEPLLRFADLAGALPEADLPHAATRFAFPKTEYTRGNARFIHCFGATLARVEVDPVDGTVRVTDLTMHTAAGPVIDLAAYLGQIEGGLVQGLGLTLTEDVAMRGARVVTANLDTYMVPTIRDVPRRLRVTALEGLDRDDPWGPRGVGELGIGAVTAAVANAVAAATGFWPAVAPVRPGAMLETREAAE